MSPKICHQQHNVNNITVIFLVNESFATMKSLFHNACKFDGSARVNESWLYLIIGRMVNHFYRTEEFLNFHIQNTLSTNYDKT